jgi:hypothetical protein
VKLSQLHIPFVASLSLGRSANLVLSTAGASSKLEDDGGGASDRSFSLDGASDVVAQLFVRLAADRLLLQAGANLPAGKRALTTDEFALARALGHPLLGFAMKQYGQGFDASGAASLGLPLGSAASAAIGAGFIHHGAYTLLDGADDFRPGAEMALSAGLDVGSTGGVAAGDAASLRLDATYRLFGKDELGGAAVFEEGDQVELEAAARTRPARIGASLLGRIVLKQDNTSIGTSGQTVREIKTKAGRSTLVQAGVDAALGSALRGGVDAEWNSFSGSDAPGEDGTAIGVGPALAMPVGARGWLRARVLLLTGTIDGGPGFAERDLSGVAAALGVHWRGGP